MRLNKHQCEGKGLSDELLATLSAFKLIDSQYELIYISTEEFLMFELAWTTCRPNECVNLHSALKNASLGRQKRHEAEAGFPVQ